jgi:hypothetical protein
MESAKDSDSMEVRNLAQKIASTLKVGRSQIIPVEKIELGLLIRALGSNYASKKGDANWSFVVHYNQCYVVLTTPIQTTAI